MIVTTTRPTVDAAAAEEAAGLLLTALGLDLTDENLTETPRRMSHALIEMTNGDDFELTTFPNDEATTNWSWSRTLPCMSLRGARSPGARTTTSAMFGKLRDDPRSRAEFFALTRSQG